MPIVRAGGTGNDYHGFVPGVSRNWCFYGASRLQINATRPIDLCVGVRGDQRAVRAVEDVEETILRRVQDHFSRAALNSDIGQGDLLGGRVIPHLAGSLLIMPDILSSVRLERHD